jgi:dTDP-glucose 4,6-dehydratase
LFEQLLVRALDGKTIGVYGTGENVRDWLYVEDHCRAIDAILQHGRLGEVYNVGGRNEWRNIDIVQLMCAVLDRKFTADPVLRERFPHCPAARGAQTRELITFVVDRPGHDWRYAIDASKVCRELGFAPLEKFETGIEKSIDWYLSNEQWWRGILSGEYRRR